MPAMDFNFQQYIAFRKGAKQAQIREGASYAFSADLRMLRKIQRLGPIPSFLEEATRLFQKKSLPSLLSQSSRATPEYASELFFAMQQCAQRLHILTPPVYVTKDPSVSGPIALGVLEELYVFVPESYLGKFSVEEWCYILGMQAGHIQNAHIALITAFYYLTSSAQGLVRFLVLPATSILSVWLKRAMITADRAGFLCTRSLETSNQALQKLSQSTKELELREQALLQFSQTRYAHSIQNQPGGDTLEDCDEKVSVLFDQVSRTQEKMG